jgi:tRNA modification GTPase
MGEVGRPVRYHGRMAAHTQDTIVALASAPGPGARAIVRLSGPRATALALPLFRRPLEPLARRTLLRGALHLDDLHAPLPADLYLWPAPNSYTGQEMAEIHTLSSPPLVELLVGQLLRAGARAARPGEFTLRAFLAGKLDLTRAEAVLAVIEAGDRDELRAALTQLAGGVARPMQALRDELLNLLADVEAGLDFADEDIRFVDPSEMLRRLGRALAQVTNLGRQLSHRSLSGRPFRAVFAGRPNAGKSSLFNALTGASALVSPEPGTTRDYLTARLDLGGTVVELIDTAGLQSERDAIDAEAQALGRDQAARADLVLLCVPADAAMGTVDAVWLQEEFPPVVALATRCDLAPAPPGMPATSALTGAGLPELRRLLQEHAASRRTPPLAPSLSRCRHHVEACLANLRRAHALVLEQDPPELLALELRLALEQLGEMAGAVYTEDLLDRIFSRFCIGK